MEDNPLLQLWMTASNIGDYHDRWDAMLKWRTEATAKYAWGIPTPSVIRRIVKWSPIIEIGAGRGYWAALVKAEGGDIVAFDLHPPGVKDENHYHNEPGLFTEVQVGGPEMVKDHRDRALLLCWPPMNEMAADCLRQQPSRVIYVGEGGGGCNASDSFFKLLHKSYSQTDFIDIPQWEGLHDDATFWERR